MILQMSPASIGYCRLNKQSCSSNVSGSNYWSDTSMYKKKMQLILAVLPVNRYFSVEIQSHVTS